MVNLLHFLSNCTGKCFFLQYLGKLDLFHHYIKVIQLTFLRNTNLYQSQTLARERPNCLAPQNETMVPGS